MLCAVASRHVGKRSASPCSCAWPFTSRWLYRCKCPPGDPGVFQRIELKLECWSSWPFVLTWA